MSKFKVGDVVRFKNGDTLYGQSMFTISAVREVSCIVSMHNGDGHSVWNDDIEIVSNKTPRSTINTWSFVSNVVDDININEIASNLTKDNPIAEVVRKGKSTTRYIIIHESIAFKMSTNEMEEDIPSCSGTVVLTTNGSLSFESSAPLSEWIAFVREVKASSWKDKDTAKVTVILPKV